jgi:hypothetical protein
MKKADVKIGGEYFANVSGNKTKVRIDSESRGGGWTATNLTTNKKVTIRTAQRLHSEVLAKSKTTKTSTQDNLTVVEIPPATVETIDGTNQEQPALVLRKPSKAKKAKTADVAATDAKPEKRFSCLTAAIKVLAESTEPLSTKQIVEAMSTKGYWSSPGGKTPEATLYSAILRDISKGEASRFVKADRGRFIVRAAQ